MVVLCSVVVVCFILLVVCCRLFISGVLGVSRLDIWFDVWFILVVVWFIDCVVLFMLFMVLCVVVSEC